MDGNRPMINDMPGQPSHPMTDTQYAEYLRKQEELDRMPPPGKSQGQRLREVEEENAELRRMIEALARGDTGEVTA